jgi:hypothetical protein
VKTTAGAAVIQHPAVHTLSVSVKVMKMGPKQVTLAVFRQLDQEDLIDDETVALRGVPWGRINYCQKNKCPEAIHLHIVWQMGEQIFHSLVPRRADLKSGVQLRRLSRGLTALQLLDWADNRPDYEHIERDREIADLGTWASLRNGMGWFDVEWWTPTVKAIRAKSAEEARLTHVADFSIAHVAKQVERYEALDATQRRTYAEHYEALGDMDLLFIAV